MGTKKKVFLYFKSLSARLLLLTLAWVSFISVTVGYTMALNWQLEASSAATKTVEDMRYHVFRSALFSEPQYQESIFVAEVAAFESDLMLLETGDSWKPLCLPDENKVSEGFYELKSHWKESLLPAIVHARENRASVSMEEVSAYVETLSSFVKVIESSRADILWQLKYLQGMLIVLAFCSLIAIMALLFRWVIRPLNLLEEGIDRVSSGDLNARVTPVCEDEIGQIAHGFNTMAERLKDYYENLEQKVADKTASVEEKNTHLKELYEMTAFLAHRQGLEDILDGFIPRTKNLTGAQACVVRLKDERENAVRVAGAEGMPAEILKLINDRKNTVLSDYDEPVLVDIADEDSKKDELFLKLREAGFQVLCIVPVRTSSTISGLCTLYFKEKRRVESGKMRVLESFATHLAVAIENNRLIEREQQYAVVQERQLFSQGLHDSIAQTLSYLNLQTQFLTDAIRTDDKALRDDSLEAIRDGVQECYVDVRELLVNYREKLHKDDFITGVETVVRRFEAQSRVSAKLKVSGKGMEPTPRQKLQIIFIIQEALSNVRKHAGAQNVEIRIENDADLAVIVTDDGVGLDEKTVEARKGRHVGLSIMAERAERIGASIDVARASPIGGTRVTLVLSEEMRHVA